MSFSTPFWSPSQASAILFDWDGVIAETRLDFSDIRKRYYDNPKAMLLEDAHKLPGELRASLMHDLEQVEVEGALSATMIPGISDILQWVSDKGIPWAVVSRNCRKSILLASEQIGVTLPAIVRSRDDGSHIKPDPRALTEVCTQLGVDASQTLFVGDFIYDMIGARRAGMRGVLVRGDIPDEWSPWLECAYTSMADFYKELLSPGEITPWEYQEAVRKNGRDFLRSNAKRSVRVPLEARPAIDTWTAKAASLGIGTFVAPATTLSPELWKQNPSFDTADMGIDLACVLHKFLLTRYPFAQVLDEGTDGTMTDLPADADELEQFLLASNKEH